MISASVLANLYAPFSGSTGYLSTSDVLMIVVGSGLVMHQVARRFEPERASQMVALVLLPPLALAVLISAVNATAGIVTSFLLGLILYVSTLAVSVVAYRLSPWHPLAGYPGPILARASKLWIALETRHGEQHILIKKLHDQYGHFVRVGPNEISICDANAILPVLGATGLPKGPSWDGRHVAVAKAEDRSLIGLRDWHVHAERRKLWNKGFSTQALKDYEEILVRRSRQLLEALEKRQGGVDIAAWIGHFTFDVMGDMAFGGGFELMRDGGDKEGVWTIIKQAIPFNHFGGHLPWLAKLLYQFAPSNSKFLKLRTFAAAQAKKRMTKGSTSADLFHHLYEVDRSIAHHSFSRITSEAILTIIAGSDTTSTVLSNVCFFLCDNPEYMTRLHTEIDQTFPEMEEAIDALRLSRMPLLNAIIYEAMRLQPPVPSGAQRSVLRGTGGKAIGGHFVPEGTQVFVHTYSIQRDPRYFSPQPDAFWPDRWLSLSERQYPKALFGPSYSPSSSFVIARIDAKDADSTTLNHNAFIPFSFGPAICAGKNLAVLEMRILVALLFQKFTLRSSESYDRARWLREQEDWFVMKLGELPVQLSARV